MQKRLSFNKLADALAVYYEHRDSLFLNQALSEKTGIGEEIIRREVIEWSGATPEELVRYLEPERIKKRISKTVQNIKRSPSGYSGIHIDAMTEEEHKEGGRNLCIRYSFYATGFGPVIIASTEKGVCYLAFSDEGAAEALEKLRSRFPHALFQETQDDSQHRAFSFIEGKSDTNVSLRLHLKGTSFQVNTWRRLLQIPAGGLMSYSALAGNLKDAHALGAAVGSNPIAYLIPCHRAVQASGIFGKYHWGANRKAALICLEAIRS